MFFPIGKTLPQAITFWVMIWCAAAMDGNFDSLHWTVPATRKFIDLLFTEIFQWLL